MHMIHKLAKISAATILLFGLSGCTVIGIGVGAVAGSGSTVGMVGGAVIGGVIGHELGK